MDTKRILISVARDLATSAREYRAEGMNAEADIFESQARSLLSENNITLDEPAFIRSFNLLTSLEELRKVEPYRASVLFQSFDITVSTLYNQTQNILETRGERFVYVSPYGRTLRSDNPIKVHVRVHEPGALHFLSGGVTVISGGDVVLPDSEGMSMPETEE